MFTSVYVAVEVMDWRGDEGDSEGEELGESLTHIESGRTNLHAKGRKCDERPVRDDCIVEKNRDPA